MFIILNTIDICNLEKEKKQVTVNINQVLSIHCRNETGTNFYEIILGDKVLYITKESFDKLYKWLDKNKLYLRTENF